MAEVRLVVGVRDPDVSQQSDSRWLRTAQLRALDGFAEERMAQALANAAALPAQVTRLLCQAVASIDHVPMTPSLAEQLLPVDRQLLMLKLAQRLDGDQVWLQAHCVHCHEPFDLSYQRSDLPVTTVEQANLSKVLVQGVRVKLQQSECHFRVPTGADQTAISACAEEQALPVLLQRLLLPGSQLPEPLQHDDIERIAEALESATPQLPQAMFTACPECGMEQYVGLNLYQLQGASQSQLLREVHYLASHYHWHEADILALPRQRRHQYLSMIDESGGQHG
ncbi:hypothetical protein [Bacterioplanoides sp.]|uniref:hypothetical protein n=1 Tax=Bacterioplanoides sp. TaxID=2066072 RepID=UPI003AFF94E7